MGDTKNVAVVVNQYGAEHVQKIIANDAADGDWFGRAVAISADKSILIVGAIGDDDGGTDTGAVYIYKQDAELDTYNPIHIQKLTASDGADHDWFGSSVSLSADKSILIVGARGDDDGGTNTGSVYIYRQNVGEDTYNPVHIQKLNANDADGRDWFGASVSLSEDESMLIVGAPGVDAGDTDTGSVYIYKQNTGQNTYNPTHIQKLTASDRAAQDQFGVSVAISADKNILVVGAHLDDEGNTDTGSVYIYQQNVGEDTYDPAHIQKLTASDGAADDLFGVSVALSIDKSILIVGACLDDLGGDMVGSVYIYQQNTGQNTYNPVHIQKLTASDRAAGDLFGISVSLSPDKSILGVGAIHVDNEGGSATGSVYIYQQLSVTEDN